MKLVVNVDDAGLHPAVTRAVEILAEKGVVTSTSIVATGLDVESAARLDGVSLGVHLDILRGRPLAHWQYVNSIVDDNGSFLINPVALFKRYAVGKVLHEQVELEWRTQIEHVISLGVKPTHLSSHKHVHAWPTLTRMAAKLAGEYEIPWVRKPEECSQISRLDKAGLQAKFLNICGLFDREVDGVNWPDVFWGVTDEGDDLTPEGFMAYMRVCGDVGEDGIVELSCCPGVTIAGDPPIQTFCNPSEISGIWRSEFKSLSELNWMDTFDRMGMELVPFGATE